MKIPFVLQAEEVVLSAIRAQGAGGQHVNKVSSAVHLRFDIAASSLPEPIKLRLLARSDQRISGDGILVIKAQTHRSQEKNRADAIARLQALIEQAASLPGIRRPTKPTAGSKRRRLEHKNRHGQLKLARGKVLI